MTAAFRPSKTLRTIAVFASGNMVAMVAGVFGSLVQARYVGPEDMGVFRTFGIVAGYLTFLHLGVVDGLQREIPLRLARGERSRAEQAASACLAWILIVSVACGTAFLALALRAAYRGDWMQFAGWLAYTPVVAATFYGLYLSTTFLAGQKFITLSNTAAIQALAGTLVLPLLPTLGYYGVCLRAAVTSATGVSLLHRRRPLVVRPRLDWPSFWNVIRVGLPLSGAGYIATSLWFSLEGTFVLGWFGVKVLGLFSMAVFVRTVVAQLAQSMTQVMNIKIYEQYGRSGRIQDCVRLIYKPILLAVAASLPLILIGWFALPWLVELLVPRYVGSIPMMRVMLWVMPLTFLNLPATILWATGRRIDCFASVIPGFLAFAALAFLLYRLDVGVLSVPVASVMGQAVNILASYVLILRLAVRRPAISTGEGVATP